jgi:hypothetical protein
MGSAGVAAGPFFIPLISRCDLVPRSIRLG